MRSDDTPQGVKDCLWTIVFNASDTANLGLNNAGQMRAEYANIIEALPADYARAIHHSVQEILRLDTPVFNDFYNRKFTEEQTKPNFGTMEELDSENLALALSGLLNNPDIPAEVYNGIMRGLNEISSNVSRAQKKTLPLDDMASAEYIKKLFALNNEPEERPLLDLSESSIEDLARKLSDIMHNPNLPEKVYRCLADELNTNHIDFYSAENILGNLKEMAEVAE